MNKKIKFLHVIGPDTKNSYGIMSQIHKTQNMEEHRFLIMAGEKVKARFPKLEEFDDNLFIPTDCPRPRRLNRILFMYRQLRDADVVIWHSLFFTSQKFLWFVFFFRNLLKKSVWIEWGADLYLWRYPDDKLKNRIKNYMSRKIRESFRFVGTTFPVDSLEYHRQFGDRAKCFYTPMPNPYKGATELIDSILATRPEKRRWENRVTVQVAHNAFTFNNHVRLLGMLERFKPENMHILLPLSYGIYGINGQFGGKAYCAAVKKYAKNLFPNQISVLSRNMAFDEYLQLLWNIDIVVFDFDRPCGLGTLRILLLMEKKIFLPAGSPYYEFLISKGLPIYDTNKIPEMTYEEFIAPPKYTDLSWVHEYMNNDAVIQNWENMFAELKETFNI